MTRSFSLALALVFLSSLAAGQAGMVGVYSDPYGTNCELDPTATGIPDALFGPQAVPYSPAAVAHFYVVHMNAVRATGIRFAAPKPACMVAEWLEDTSIFTLAGDSQNGITVNYNACKTGTFCVLTLAFVVGTEPTPECCFYPVLADPSASSGRIEVVHCDDGHVDYATGFQGIINATTACDCNIPVGESTWGRVKALYGQ